MWLTNLFKKKKVCNRANYDYDLHDAEVHPTARQWYRIYEGSYGSHPSYDGYYLYCLSMIRRWRSYKDNWESDHKRLVRKFNSEL